MSVRVNDSHDYVQELSLILSTELSIDPREVLHCEHLEQGHHARFLLLLDPLLLEGLEQQFVEF